MNRILVATDGSEGAERAVDYAARQAQAEGAELVIANVTGDLPDKVFGAFTRTQQTWFDELVSSVSADILAKAREHAKRVGVAAVHLESRRGDVVQTIIDMAEDKQATVIVVGKRGAGRVTGLLIGSVSQKLVSLATLPVTVVP